MSLKCNDVKVLLYILECWCHRNKSACEIKVADLMCFKDHSIILLEQVKEQMA